MVSTERLLTNRSSLELSLAESSPGGGAIFLFSLAFHGGVKFINFAMSFSKMIDDVWLEERSGKLAHEFREGMRFS